MQTYKKLIVTTLSPNFRAATQLVQVALPTQIKSSDLLVKNYYTGINASDVNYTAGFYSPGVTPPFDCGFEALGQVVGVGSSVHTIKIGDFVVTRHFGSFAQYQLVPLRAAKKVPSLQKEWIPLDLSGTTASIALQQVLKPQKGERAVVTAAAGGTGHIAVQLLKNVYGCQVVGVCSKRNKAELLSNKLQCDGVICTTNNMNLREQIMRLYPAGANIAYESVGGEVLQNVIAAMSLRSRILSIGSMSTYIPDDIKELSGQQLSSSSSPSSSSSSLPITKQTVTTKTPIPLQLLSKSATLHTFFLPHYLKYTSSHFDKLCKLREQGLICPVIDNTAQFKGIESIADAVEHMFARLNNGKVIVQL